MRYLIVNTTTGKLCNQGKRYPRWLALWIATKYKIDVQHCDYVVVHVKNIRVK